MKIFLHPVIDSRKVLVPEKTIFFALKGNTNDGHEFVGELYSKGVRNFVVNQAFNSSSFTEAKFLKTENVLAELQKYAIKYRENFVIPIVAITGSNGKTIVKEWLSKLLSSNEIVCRTPRSYNSQIGVPLSVLELKSFHTIGVFEAGISQKDEMIHLEKIIQPDYGIFTNIGSAHSSGFSSMREKVKEKLKLFRHSKLLIYCSDYTEINEEIKKSNIPSISWSFSTSKKSDYHFSVKGKKIICTINNKSESYNFSFIDKASIENLIHCIVFLKEVKKFSASFINKQIQKLEKVNMRMSLKKGINNCTIIDDSYNYDLLGLQSVLEFMNTQPSKKNKTIILSDIADKTLDKVQYFELLNKLFTENQIHKVIWIGNEGEVFQKFSTNKIITFKNTSDFLTSNHQFSNELILIKGARSFKFENIVLSLEEKQHKTVLQINLHALVQNLNVYKSYLNNTTKIMAMVKAFSYGNGAEEVATILQANGVDYLAVAYADEGVKLRQNGIKLPIMVMNVQPEDYPNIEKYKLEPQIFSFESLNHFIAFGNFKLPIHVKIDTGMHRLGFITSELEQIEPIILKNKIQIASVLTHLATADELHNDFAKQQFNEFNKALLKLNHCIKSNTLCHILNSSGIVSNNDFQMDMVRIGIGLYGFDPTGLIQQKLSQVTSFYSTISQIKNIKKGETVGYAQKGKATKDLTVATISVGYADGLNRLLSNGIGNVYINGSFAPIIGNICMDMTMIDVTSINCAVGDTVELFGEHISVMDIANKVGTISYEILTSISERVKRVYIKE